MRRSVTALLVVLLAGAGAPGFTALGSGYACPRGGERGTRTGGALPAGHAADCRMACCKRPPASTGARPVRGEPACSCRTGGHRQLAGFAAGSPWILPSPPRLPMPRGSAVASMLTSPAVALPILAPPERPPRA